MGCGESEPVTQQPSITESETEAPIVGPTLQGPVAVLMASGPVGSRELLKVRKDSIARHPYPLDQKQIPIDGIKTGDRWEVLSSRCIEDSGTTCAPVVLTSLDESLRQRSQTMVADEGSQVQVAASDTAVVVAEITETRATLISVASDGGTVTPIWESDPFDMSKIRENANRTQNFSVQSPGFRMCASSKRVLASYAGPDGKPPQLLEIREEGRVDVRETPGLSEQPDFLSCATSPALAVSARPESWETLDLDSGDTEQIVADLPGMTSRTAADPYSASMTVSSTDLSAAMEEPAPSEPLPTVVTLVELVDDMTVSTLFEGPSNGIPVVTTKDNLIAWISGESIVLE